MRRCGVQPSDPAVVVHRCEDYATADLITRVLLDEGVPAAMVNDSPSAGITGTVTLGDGLDSAPWASFAILVPETHAPRAAEIVRDWLAATPVSEET